jgi:hypothetical protein
MKVLDLLNKKGSMFFWRIRLNTVAKVHKCRLPLAASSIRSVCCRIASSYVAAHREVFFLPGGPVPGAK